LREAAQRQRNDGAGDSMAQLTSSAADGLDHLSRTLRSKDVGTMLRDMDNFARNQPVAFFGIALAAGFVAVRFLKADRD
jgi:lauroyl/myristoyl acyltransferase